MRGVKKVLSYFFSLAFILLTFTSVFVLSYNILKRVYPNLNANIITKVIPSPTMGVQIIPSVMPLISPTNENNFIINIYNGTKYSGLAYASKILLESKGYNVGEIGNANRRDYSITLIKFKNGVDTAILKDIQTLLEGQGYNVAEPEVEDNLISDIVINLGKV